jgi:hypothetical protein
MPESVINPNRGARFPGANEPGGRVFESENRFESDNLKPIRFGPLRDIIMPCPLPFYPRMRITERAILKKTHMIKNASKILLQRKSSVFHFYPSFSVLGIPYLSRIYSWLGMQDSLGWGKVLTASGFTQTFPTM